MKTTPCDAIDFQKRFGTEEQCEQFLFKLRWPKGFICPNCQHDDGSFIRTRRLYQCFLCKHQTSITSGTIFHRTHLPLVCWFWIIYQMTHDKGGASATRLASQLQRPYKTIWHVVHKLRHAMGSRDAGLRLGGTIEFDEAMLGPEARRLSREELEASKAGRKIPSKKPWGRKGRSSQPRKKVVEVFVMAEAEHFHIGNVSMKVADRVDYQSIEEFAEKNSEPGQYYCADAKQSHWMLRYMGHKFKATKSTTKPYVESLPVVHRVISLLKHFLMGTYYGVSTKHLPSYLHEFCFRFIRREKESTMYESLLRACLFTVPMTYAELKL